MHAQLPSHVPLFATLWTVARQVLCPWNFPGKNTGVGCHFLLQGNLPNPGIKPLSPALTGGFFTTEPPGKPKHRGIRRKKGMASHLKYDEYF